MSERTIVIEHNRLAVLIDEYDARRLYRIRVYDSADIIAHLFGCTFFDYETLAQTVPCAMQQFETRMALARAVHALFFEEQD